MQALCTCLVSLLPVVPRGRQLRAHVDLSGTSTLSSWPPPPWVRPWAGRDEGAEPPAGLTLPLLAFMARS